MKAGKVALAMLLPLVCSAKNKNIFDLENPVVFSAGDQTDIEFGYSLALFFNQSYRSLLIGAPSANTTQKEVRSPGALYSCDLPKGAGTFLCAQIAVDARGAEDKYVPFIDEDLKDFQRLGASLASRNGDVVVCAPNWHYYERRITGTIDAPVGLCFRSTSLEDFAPFSVPYDITEGNPLDYLNYGSCQCGFSSSLLRNNSLVLGSPGCYNWEGEAFADAGSGFIKVGKGFTAGAFEGNGAGDEVLWLSNMHLGYSVAQGQFRGQAGVVAGMPRSAQPNSQVMNPAVIIYIIEEERLNLWTTLTPPRNDKGSIEPVWLFSYFGYAVAVADVDGDGFDDVVVGAPFYHNATNFDQGAVLVFMQTGVRETDGNEQKFGVFLERGEAFRTGQIDYGRFGSAVASLGDLNGDGVQDIGVGAPYADGGRVYIFLGDRKGLSKDPHQVLSPSEKGLQGLNLQGFGGSFALNFQMEEGPQNDVAVGASFADSVVVFRTKVLVAVDWTVSFPVRMDLSSDCPFDGKTVPCAYISTCLQFTFLQRGKLGDTRPKEFQLHHDLDTNSLPKRLFFDDGKRFRSTSVFVEFEQIKCFTETVYTHRQMSSLDAFEIVSAIEEDHAAFNGRDQRTLHTDQVTLSRNFLEIEFECESANVSGCVSDLHLETRASPSLVQVSDAKFNVWFKIVNYGETSYSNKLEVSMDPFLEISGKAQILEDSTVSPSIDCRLFERGKGECTLGTFLNANDLLKFELSFVTTEDFIKLENLRNHANKFEVKSTLKTLSKIKFPSAASSDTDVAIEADPEFYLTKNESSTDLVTLKKDFTYLSPTEAEDDDSVGPKIDHIYEIYNEMNYAIENNILKVFWPRTINGLDLVVGKVVISPPAYRCKTSLQKGHIKGENKSPSVFGDIVWKVTSCDIPLLEPQESVDVLLDLRLVMKTVIEEIYNPDFDEIRSYVKLESRPVILGLKMVAVVSNDIGTNIDYGDFIFRLVPKWVYALGAGIGLVLLVFIIYCLRRFNFFKRKKTDNLSQENLASDEVHDEVEEEPNEELNAMIPRTSNED